MFNKLLQQVKQKPIYFLLLLSVVVAGTLLRTWKLDSHAIFFGDAGHDLLTAKQAIDTGNLPLLGIESSKPEIRQGPLAIWINALTLFLFGDHLLPVSIVYAVLGLAAVIGLYELVTTQINPKAGLIAASLLALSPLAIAHSRMPYHTTPIPFFVVLYLYALTRLWQKKPKSLFWAVLAWTGVFQFELATFPLLLPILFVLYKQKRLAKIDLRQPTLGLAIGLAPQIIYDVSHGLGQLGYFIAWVGYRTGSSIIGGNQLSVAKMFGLAETFGLWLGRFFSVDQPYLVVMGLLLLLVAVYYSAKKFFTDKPPPLITLSLVSLASLLAAFIIHGAPSEAYFPPFLILMPILISYYLAQLSKKFDIYIVFGLLLWGVVSGYTIFTNNFFVDSTSDFSYGPSVYQQKIILKFVNDQSQSYYLRTTAEAGKHEKYFDNFKWLITEYQLKPVDHNGIHVFVEKKDSPLVTYPNVLKVPFESLDLYTVLP